MTSLGFIVLLILPAAAQDEAPPSRVPISMVAIQALNEGRAERYFDSRIRNVRRAIEGLDYDTFHLVRSEQRPVPFGEETRMTINDEYSLFVTPKERERDGRMVTEVRITVQRKGRDQRPMNVLDTTVRLAPGKPILLGGPPLGAGELIVVLSI